VTFNDETFGDNDEIVSTKENEKYLFLKFIIT